MTPDDVKAMIVNAITAQSMNSARTAQSLEGRLGASEIGMCRSYLWRFIKQDPRDEDARVPWKAFIGTWLGEGVETTLASGGAAQVQEAVVTTLPSGRTVPGHVDVWFPATDDDPGSVWDLKSIDGTAAYERTEPDRSHKFQILLYHLALVQANKIRPDAPAFVVYLDRSGKGHIPVVKQVDVSDEAIFEVDQWLDDAIYGVVNSEEPSRDRPYEWCKVACPYFSDCRGSGDHEAAGVITEPVYLTAVEMYQEGSAQSREGAKMMEAARTVLTGVSGSTGEVFVSWTNINATSVSYERGGYSRLNIKPIRKKP